LKRGHRVLETSMELKADCRRAPLFLFLRRVLKIIVFSPREWQRSEQESRARHELLIVDPRSHESTGMDLSASPFSGTPLSTVCRQIFKVGLEETQVDEINLR
jgi:hypothetical protein